jgi:release factor glutamine methyltransferase
MKIDNWLREGTKKLTESGVSSARLDCLILLEDALGKDRAFVLAHGEEIIPKTSLIVLNTQLERRQQREPLAYIRGWSEFYGRPFSVSKDVLIPRPETEVIIEEALALRLPPSPLIADVGTGSGILAITLKLELPSAQVYACDTSSSALLVAQRNAQALEAAIDFEKSDLLSSNDRTFDLIIANLPYVTAGQHTSPETAYEPKEALYAANDGLADIERLLLQLNSSRLKKGGYLLLEAEPSQHAAITAKAHQQNLRHLHTKGFVQLFEAID